MCVRPTRHPRSWTSKTLAGFLVKLHWDREGGGFCCCCNRPPGTTSDGTVGWQPRRGETVEEGEESRG